MENIGMVRRYYFVEKKSIREICRILKMGRGTVRKIIRSGVTEFKYERKSQPYPKLEHWCERLDKILEENEALTHPCWPNIRSQVRIAIRFPCTGTGRDEWIHARQAGQAGRAGCAIVTGGDPIGIDTRYQTLAFPSAIAKAVAWANSAMSICLPSQVRSSSHLLCSAQSGRNSTTATIGDTVPVKTATLFGRATPRPHCN